MRGSGPFALLTAVVLSLGTSLALADGGAVARSSAPSVPMVSSTSPAAGLVAVVAPDPPGITSDHIDVTAVACPARRVCLAVGTLTLTDGNVRPVVERWAGGRWTATAPALPADADPRDGAVLTDIACAAADACVAVGYYNGGSATAQGPIDARPLAETWDGSTWTAGAPPLPADAGVQGNLAGSRAVDCASSTSCTAVGWYTTTDGTQRPMAQQYDGGGWTTAALPRPGAGSVFASLVDVDCPAAGACVAVGAVGATAARPLLEIQRAGGAWSGGTGRLPPDAITRQQFNSLDAVSCPVAHRCVAVGGYAAGPTGHLHEAGLIEVLDGDAQTALSQPPPSGSPQASLTLTSVSCWRDLDCLAGGPVSGASGTPSGLTSVSGAAGGSVISLQTSDAYGPVSAIDCTPSGACLAVTGPGPSGSPSLVTVRDGAVGATISPLPPGTHHGYLEDAAVPPGGRGVAVGRLERAPGPGSQAGLLVTGIGLP